MADLSKHYTLHWCPSCMGHFDTEDVLKTHKLYSRGVDTTAKCFSSPMRTGKYSLKISRLPPNPFTLLISTHYNTRYQDSNPTPLKFCVFLTCRYLAKAPFVVYADIEALVMPTGKDHPERGHRSFD